MLTCIYIHSVMVARMVSLMNTNLHGLQEIVQSLILILKEHVFKHADTILLLFKNELITK